MNRFIQFWYQVTRKDAEGILREWKNGALGVLLGLIVMYASGYLAWWLFDGEIVASDQYKVTVCRDQWGYRRPCP